MKNKKGFTLIELLGVIVLLAIIAVIATPIIVGIIEDSRKASFERSVEAIIKATELDFGIQDSLVNNIYEIEDGQITNTTLKVPIQNLEGFNGTIKFDENGKNEYAIYNDKWCMTKTRSGISTTEYVEGECTLSESSGENETLLDALATIRNLVPNENDVITSGDGQLINLGEYGIRYQGADPNNYVEFNNETWRIIGIVDGKLKLIRDESIGSMAWDTDETNNWSEATLQTYLNGEYYNSLTDKDMIDTSTWYLRGYITTEEIDKYEMYGIERGTGSISSVVMYDTPSIDRNIGLMYPSDYGFAAQVTSTCTDTKDLFNYEPCKTTNWIANTQTSDFEWIIMPYSDNMRNAFYAYSSGVVTVSYVFNFRVNNSYDVRPVLYLKSNVKFTGDGDGAKTDKYQLEINN